MVQKIKEILSKYVSGVEYNVDVPDVLEFGDYSTNAALQLKASGGKYKNKNPREIAKELVEKLQKDKDLTKIISKIEIAGPGFINFWFSEEILSDVLVNTLKYIDTTKKSSITDKRVMIEYGQPNTHKLPHIGHLFSYIYGETCARLLESSGAVVFRANYQGDVGPQVAKCLWALKKFKPTIPGSIDEKASLLQKMYQDGNAAYDTDEKAKEEIHELNTLIYAKDKSILSLWEETRSWSLEYYKKFEQRLGIHYDKYYFESQVYSRGLKEVESHLGDVFEESQGAITFPGEKFGLHRRVFVTQFKTPTYEAKDLALEQVKMEDWPYDLLVITTANEQSEYFKVVFKALEQVNKSLIGKLKHIGFGMVNLKSGKMSSRTGNILSAVDLVDTVIEEALKIISGRKDLEKDKKERIAEEVGLAAVKYAFLKNNPLQDTKFDIKESVSIEGNSGPYLQYTYARIQSVLRNGLHEVTEETKKRQFGKIEPNREELLINRALIHFPEVVQNAALNYSPNTLCNYLFDLAQKFNNFYNNDKIIGSDNEEYRMALTKSLGEVLSAGLNLLGITPLNKM